VEHGFPCSEDTKIWTIDLNYLRMQVQAQFGTPHNGIIPE
jgi:hypothetical protein